MSEGAGAGPGGRPPKPPANRRLGGDTPAAHPASPAVLAIDGGNSKTDAALVARDGTLLGRARGPGSNPHIVGTDPAFAILRGLVDELAGPAGPAGRPGGAALAAHVCACLAGADLPDEEASLGALLAEQGWGLTSALVNDTFAVLRAGLVSPGGRPWGVAVTCGAGINCVGVGPDGTEVRFLSLGEVSGDWGGGESLGRDALWWANRAEDGRGPATVLRDAVAAHFGLAAVREVAVRVHRHQIPEDALLDLAPVVLRAAGDGDAVAAGLVSRLAEEVCTMALAAIRRLGLAGQPVPVILGGGPAHRARPAAQRADRGPAGGGGAAGHRPGGGRAADRGSRPARPGPCRRGAGRGAAAARRLRPRAGPPPLRSRRPWRPAALTRLFATPPDVAPQASLATPAT